MRSAVTLPSFKKSGILGIKELRTQVAAILDKTTAESLKGIFHEAGMLLYNRLLGETSQHVSVGNKKFPPGTLQRGVFISDGKPGKANVIVGIGGRDGANYLAIWLEHGTYKQQARPFFRPAVLAERPGMAQVIGTGLKTTIDQAAQ